jgi:Domain of unknown function (DUF4150)/A nuclease family of the HNH/ENDO VII superfamily with conserved AHH
MAKNSTLVNGMSPVTKKSDGKVVAFPDTCKVPSPAGPMSAPFPNISQSSDLARGSKTVEVDGAPVCLKDSNFATSTGDEAGTAGGVASSKTKGKAEPISYSFDVKIEGKPVVRNMDLFLANDKNTPPAPVMQTQVTPALSQSADKGKAENCEFCGKAQHAFAKHSGTNVGISSTLDRNIMNGLGIKKNHHRWYSSASSISAHHLICSEALDDDEWVEICRKFGYDINRKENGVMLPNSMQLACQLHAPLHRGPHGAGSADGETYPRRIKQLIGPLKDRALGGAYCANPSNLTDDMDTLSRLIAQKVDGFLYTLTADGLDYTVGGCGCAGATSVTNKPKRPCPHNRLHGVRQPGNGPVIQKKPSPLKVGE